MSTPGPRRDAREQSLAEARKHLEETRRSIDDGRAHLEGVDRSIKETRSHIEQMRDFIDMSRRFLRGKPPGG